jgi:hypothetical protein
MKKLKLSEVKLLGWTGVDRFICMVFSGVKLYDPGTVFKKFNDSIFVASLTLLNSGITAKETPGSVPFDDIEKGADPVIF